MSTIFDDLKKCINDLCGNIIDENELQKEKKKYIKESKKNCKQKDFKEKFRCSMDIMKKSKFYELAEKRNKCTRVKCKKEQTKIAKLMKNSFKNIKKTLKNTKKPVKNTKKPVKPKKTLKKYRKSKK